MTAPRLLVKLKARNSAPARWMALRVYGVNEGQPPRTLAEWALAPDADGLFDRRVAVVAGHRYSDVCVVASTSTREPDCPPADDEGTVWARLAVPGSSYLTTSSGVHAERAVVCPPPRAADVVAPPVQRDPDARQGARLHHGNVNRAHPWSDSSQRKVMRVLARVDQLDDRRPWVRARSATARAGTPSRRPARAPGLGSSPVAPPAGGSNGQQGVWGGGRLVFCGGGQPPSTTALQEALHLTSCGWVNDFAFGTITSASTPSHCSESAA